MDEEHDGTHPQDENERDDGDLFHSDSLPFHGGGGDGHVQAVVLVLNGRVMVSVTVRGLVGLKPRWRSQT